MRGAGALALLAAAAALLAAGCPARPPVARPYPPPAPAELLAALTARQGALRALNARVRATSWLGGERVRATVQMLADRGGRLRFEAEISLQGTVAVLTTDGAGGFALLDLQKNLLQRGPACPENVASMIRIPLDPADVAAILLGDARVPAGAAPVEVAWDGERGADVLVLSTGLRVSFRRGKDGRYAPVGAEQRQGEAPLWRARFDGLEEQGGVALPGTILFAQGEGSFDDGVEIRVKERTINEEPPPGAFRLEPPEGVRVIAVGCGASTSGR